MFDGFLWARVISKQLRFLYETVTLQPTPPYMYELAAKIDRRQALSTPGGHRPPAQGHADQHADASQKGE